MEEKQRINCNVVTCKFNNGEHGKCMLNSIIVEPMYDVDTKKADESMCASYEYEE